MMGKKLLQLTVTPFFIFRVLKNPKTRKVLFVGENRPTTTTHRESTLVEDDDSIHIHIHR